MAGGATSIARASGTAASPRRRRWRTIARCSTARGAARPSRAPRTCCALAEAKKAPPCRRPLLRRKTSRGAPRARPWAAAGAPRRSRRGTGTSSGPAGTRSGSRCCRTTSTGGICSSGGAATAAAPGGSSREAAPSTSWASRSATTSPGCSPTPASRAPTSPCRAPRRSPWPTPGRLGRSWGRGRPTWPRTARSSTTATAPCTGSGSGTGPRARPCSS
mmetsp:Transcript_27290/g.77465  ORF Transcript_27290/g.77465 Transcript_27290/m.77465 type:complete len:218 (+) Transcript_27290:1471-2124(+)